MASVASRDLRNHTAEVLRQVAAGTPVTITVNGTPVAEISPLRGARPPFLTRSDLINLVAHHQADPGMTSDLDGLTGETTDDLDTW